MADLPADLLIVTRADGEQIPFDDVTYCPWRDGVTVYRDGEQIAEYNDVVGLHSRRAAVPA